MADDKIATLTLDDVKARLTDRVRAMILDALPNEAIEKAIEQEFRRITEGYSVRQAYGPPTEVEPLLRTIIRERMEPIVRETVERSFRAWIEDPCNNERVTGWIERAVTAAARAHFDQQVSAVASMVLSGALQCRTCRAPCPRGQTCSACGVWNE